MSQTAPNHANELSARIVLTRSVEDCKAWAQALQARGIESISLPCIETESLTAPAQRVALENALAKTHWLALTSQRGVSALAELLGHPLPGHVRVAAVGAATGAMARELLGRADFVASVSSAAGLATELANQLGHDQKKIVLALAENAGEILANILTKAGHQCMRFDIYRTMPAAAANTRRTLSEIGAQTVFLASPSAVVGFVNQVEIDDTARLISIGPSTTAAMRRAGLSVHAEAETPGLSGMLKAIEE